MLLSIPLQYFIKWEEYTKFEKYGFTPHCVRYIFSLPDKLGQEGYTVYVETNDFQYLNGKIINVGQNEVKKSKININVDNSLIFEATKTLYREENKRYKRIKYSAVELNALYNSLDLDTAKIAVAKVLTFTKSRSPHIISEQYVIGKIVGCWFYSDEIDTKRRLNTKGLEIISEIDSNNIAQAEALMKDRESALQEEYRRYESLRKKEFAINNIKNYCNDINRTHFNDSDAELNSYIQNIFQYSNKAINYINSARAEHKSIIEKIEQNFRNNIKNLK